MYAHLRYHTITAEQCILRLIEAEWRVVVKRRRRDSALFARKKGQSRNHVRNDMCRYKCPACNVGYCSVGCYKKHKECKTVMIET